MNLPLLNRTASQCLVILLSFIFSNCGSSSTATPPKAATKSFAVRFNEKHEDDILLLSCIAYAVENTKGLNVDSVKGFYEISSLLPASENIDSSLEAFVSVNKSADFNSAQADKRILQFKNSYYLVDRIIYGGINDDSAVELKLLEEKIDKVPEITKIYRMYVAKDRDPGSLSSGEGSSLLIHLAYYFSIQDTHKRNEILKRLL